MTPTDIRDRFLSEAQEIIRDEGWNLPDEAGDEEDLVTKICYLTPDPEAFGDPLQYLEDLEDELNLGSFVDVYEDMKRDVIWTAEIERIYQENSDECDHALMEYYSDLSEAAEGCWSISDLMSKAVEVWIDREWRGFLFGVESRLEDLISEIVTDLEENDD